MQIPPEERPKIIGLAAGIGLMICVFCVTVVPRLLPRGPHGELLHGSPPTAAAAQPRAAPTQSAGTAATAGAGPPTSVVVEIPSPRPSATAIDPFWRPLALSLLPPKMTTTPVHPPVTGLSSTSTPNPAFPGHSGSGKLAPVAPPPLPEVELQGIVQDETAMAVLAIGGQVRFLKAGEMLEGGWVVSRIQTATVVLRQGTREVVLVLGQTHLKEAVQDNKGLRGVADSLPPFHSVTLEP